MTGILQKPGAERSSDFRYDWIGSSIVRLSRRDFTDNPRHIVGIHLRLDGEKGMVEAIFTAVT